MENNTYLFERTVGGCVVTVNGQPLDPRFDLWDHSPDGFEAGYGESGSAQLSLAILAYELKDDDQAVRRHLDFNKSIIAKRVEDTWKLTSSEIRVWKTLAELY